MPRTIEAIAWLETPLRVDRTLAGMSYNITLGSRRVRLTLPLENLEGTIHDTMRPDPPVPRFPGKRTPAPTRVARGTSGSALVIGDGLLVVTAVWLRIPADSDLAVPYESWPVRRVAEEFGTWLVQAEAWLDAWTGAVRQSISRAGPPLFRAAVRGGDGRLAGVGTGGPVPVRITGQRGATREEVEASFAAASTALEVPLAHLVLRRSIVELYAADYRLCVIDACSAAESAMSTATTAYVKVRGLSDTQIEQLLRLAAGVGEAFPMYNQLMRSGASATSRNRVIDQLAGPRNRAAHAGEHLDETTAQRAVDTARLLVHEAVPLPSPAEVVRKTHSTSRRRRVATDG